MDLSTLSDSDLQNLINQQSGLAAISQGIIGQESGNNPNVQPSIDGAIGQAQIMPSTFAQYAKPGEDINNPTDNLAVHQRIIDDLSKKSGGDPARIAVGYFSGPGNIAPLDSPTPWKHDRTDGNGKSVSSYVSDVLGRINPISSVNAAEMPSYVNQSPAQQVSTDIAENPSNPSLQPSVQVGNPSIGNTGYYSDPSASSRIPDLSQLSNQQLDAQIAQLSSQVDPSGMGAQPWSALHIQSQALPDVAPSQLDNARSALANQSTSGLRGLLAHETAMGANFISQFPGFKEAGSGLAALLGAGQGSTFGQRYNNLEDAQTAMRQAGSEYDPTASALAKVGGFAGGMGLLNGIGAAGVAALPETISTPLAAIAAKYPKITGMVSNGLLGGLYGASEGNDASQRGSNALIDGAIGAVASPILGYAADKFLPTATSKLASGSGNAAADELAAPIAPTLETDLKKIDPNTPIKQYENVVNPEDMTKGPAYYEAQNTPPAPDAVAGNAPAAVPTEVPIPQTPPVMGTKGAPKTSAEMQVLTNGAYANANASGAVLKPDAVNAFVDAAEKLAPQTEAGKIALGETPTTQLIQRLQALRGKPLSLAEVQELDEGIGNLVPTDLGRPTKEGVNLLKVQDALRGTVANAGENDIIGGKEGFDALVQARKYAQQMYKMRDVERIVNRANGKDNPGLVIRNGLATLHAKLLENPRGWSPQEIAAVKTGSSLGPTAGLARVFGSRLVPIASTVLGEATGGMAGAALAGGLAHVASSGARKIVNNAARSRAENVLSTIGKNTIPKARK